MASKRTDSDQDEDEDPWGLNQFEADALAALRSLGTAPTLECIDRSPEMERSREHPPDLPVIVLFSFVAVLFCIIICQPGLPMSVLQLHHGAAGNWCP